MSADSNTINDVPRAEREMFKRLLENRSIISYVFDYQALKKLLKRLGLTTDDAIREAIAECVLATNDKCTKQDCGKCAACVKTALNDDIMRVMSENRISKSLRFADALGFPMDFTIMNGTSVQFSKERAMEWAVSNGISAKKFDQMYTAGLGKGTKYTTLTARSVKEVH